VLELHGLSCVIDRVNVSMRVLTRVDREPKTGGPLWAEEQRSKQKSLRPHAQRHALCYGACTVLSSGELSNSRSASG
jgi:hypothetical protein